MSGCKGDQEDADAAAKLASDLAEADARLRNNKVEDAEKIYTRVLEKYPDNAEAIAGIGRVRWEQKNLPDAEKFLAKAVANAPEDADLQYTLGLVYAQQNKHPEAVEAFGHAYEKDSENSEYGLNYGRQLKITEQYDKAEEVLRGRRSTRWPASSTPSSATCCGRPTGSTRPSRRT
jgi:tetratricopeptide (TPR) repeat protein